MLEAHYIEWILLETTTDYQATGTKNKPAQEAGLEYDLC